MGYSTKKKKFRGKTKGVEDYRQIGRFIVITWILVISVLFPLFVNDGYFDILQAKFYFFAYTTAAMILLILFVVFLDKGSKQMFERIREKGFIAWQREEVDFLDKCILVFWLFSAISTLLTFQYTKLTFSGNAWADFVRILRNSIPYMKAAFYGNKGRYTGLLLISLYCLAYFYVSRYIQFRKYLFAAFTLVGDLVCIFGITDYFRLDIFGFEEKMAYEQIGLFTSTIGNINTFTTYVGFVVALAGGIFVMSRVRSTDTKDNRHSKEGESLFTMIFYYISMIIGFFALTLGKSDNAYLTLIAFFGFLPFIAFRKKYGIRRYMLTLATYLSVIKVIDIINKVYTGPVSGIDGFFHIIINFLFLEVLIVLLWVITAVLYMPTFRRKTEQTIIKEPMDLSDSENAPKAFLIGWTVFFCIVLFAIIGLLIYANTRSYKEVESLGDLGYYLHFRDSWGTFRGYIWRVSVEEYGKMGILHKLFGTGPDTFGIYMIARRGNEMLRTTGTQYDSAHNEYLHYLVTIGPIALLAYLGILGETIRRGLSRLNNATIMPYMAAGSFLVICYAFQAIVNINLPISTPVMWMFMMMIAGITRADKKTAMQH